MASTNVPQPTFGPAGFVAPPEAEILAGTQADINAAFGGNLNFSTQGGAATNPTPQGQLAASEAAIIGDANALFLWFCNQVDPAFSSGRMQDAIGRIYFISRIPGAPTVVQATCSGLAGVVIPIGALAKDANGNLYTCTQGGTIPASGSIVLPFAATVDGPTPCAAGALSTIYQTIYGWDSIINASAGALGQLVETAAQFEARRALSTAINSMGPLDAILAAALNVPGVLDAYANENDTNSPVIIGGVTILANSIYVCVLGGASSAVAQAIWSKKAPGCGYTGNTVITVTDPNPQYAPPAPSYAVAYETPTLVPFAVRVLMVNGATVPANALALIQAAIISAFAGGDGGPRAKIGSNVLASRYYAGILALGAWAQYGALLEIKIGRSAAAASFTGAIAGTTLTVGNVAAGALVIGQMLQDTSGNLVPGTIITAGSGTNWTVSPAQTVASEAMTAAAIGDNVQMNINEAPTVSAGNIALILQ